MQATQLVERWQPWWYLPEAGEIQLTAHGTRPVKPLAEADTPAEELRQQGGEPCATSATDASPLPEPPSERVGQQQISCRKVSFLTPATMTTTRPT